MKYIFIINPTSGKGLGKRIGKNIEEYMKTTSLDYVIHYTSFSKEATKIARSYRKGHNIIYSVGGDGTLNEVLNGIVGSKNYLGVIPAGSGNDFYRVIKTMNEEYFQIDLGKVNKLYFINIASVGVDAEVANNIELMKQKHIPLPLLYPSSILYTFFNFKFNNLEFKLNHQTKKGIYTMITVCNGKYYGNGILASPNSDLQDKNFDIYFVDQMPKTELPRFLSYLKKGKHEILPSVHKRLSNKLIISSKQDLICNIDGEIIRSKKFKFKVLELPITIYNNQELVNNILNYQKNN